MMFVRPVAAADHTEILALAHEAGIGMTSLPPDAQVLENKISRSLASFAGEESFKGNEAFLMVLEDSETGKLVGTTGIWAHVGIRDPFYSYKLSTIVQASSELGIYSLQRVLHMVNDYTGVSEIGSLFLKPGYRRDGIGKFLSRCRFLMMAEFPHFFADRVISEIRGVQDEHGDSPFYKNLAQHFFQMEFQRADFIHATQGGQFISDLMPKYPIYVNLLAPSAQAAISVPLDASRPAMQMLEQEGFRYQGYIDVFDGGPTLQADRASIRSVRKSRNAKVVDIANVVSEEKYMVGNTAFPEFRVVHTMLEKREKGIAISQEAAQALNISVGDSVRFMDL